jgi:hypothetical protein
MARPWTLAASREACAGAESMSAAAGTIETNAPLYLLTYDHGGLILWGTDHFQEAFLIEVRGYHLALDCDSAFVLSAVLRDVAGLFLNLPSLGCLS